MRRPHLLDPHRTIPLVGGGHGAAVRAETDRIDGPAEVLAAELPEVQLAARRHLGVAGIAEMRVVRPEYPLRLRAARAQELGERLEHMLVAQVPRGRLAVIHDAV